MTTVADIVLEETKRFHQALPGLLETRRGRWVVFKDGEVRSDHATQNAAYAAGLKMFGKDGGFVIALVSEVTSTPVNAGALFGIT